MLQTAVCDARSFIKDSTASANPGIASSCALSAATTDSSRFSVPAFVPAACGESAATASGGADGKLDGADTATAAAIADGLTTGLALGAGAIETNPLIATNPIGLVAMTGLKIGLVQYADTLPTEDKRAVMKTSSAVWGGAAANNLLVLLAAPTPLSIVAGLVAGVMIWNHMDEKYQEEDRILAEQKTKEAAPVTVETAAADPAQTSGN